MFELDKEKQTQINQILQLVKIASLCFPSIAFFQYYAKNNASAVFFTYSFLLMAVLLTMLGIYTLLYYIQDKMSDKLVIKPWISPLISLTIAFLAVVLTGTYESNYKFLFVLVIISTSIECNMKISLSISSLSAVIVLIIDLVYAPAIGVNSYFESDLVLASVFLIISWTIGFYVDLGKKHSDSLANLANTDGLTGLNNHRFFYDALAEQVKQSKIEGSALSLLFIDIDDFKYYNDLYGHQKGDNVIKTLAMLMKKTLPEKSIIARYGGEEFSILLPGSVEEQAMQEAEAVRRAVHEYEFAGEENLPSGTLTISIGVSSLSSKINSEAELLKCADDACYRAKFLRKNRVEAYYSILEELQNEVDESDKSMIASIKTLIAVINAKDKYTYLHVEKVVYYCNLLADQQGMSEKDKKNFVYAAYLHDIGKINIPEEILMKVEKLTPEEWNILKSHPQNAAEIIKNIESLKTAIPIILQH
ncbi:MAG TPA: diguanylate cyclase, partial [Bacillota bacterium]|nr:diguanylate cyclase [Bacillota bacterium]